MRTINVETRESASGALSDVRVLQAGRWISVADLPAAEHTGRHKGKDKWRLAVEPTTIVGYFMRNAAGKETVRVEFPDGEERIFESFAEAEQFAASTERIVPSIIGISPAMPRASAIAACFGPHLRFRRVVPKTVVRVFAGICATWFAA